MRYNKETHHFHKHKNHVNNCSQLVYSCSFRCSFCTKIHVLYNWLVHLQSFLHFFLGFGTFLPEDVDVCILVEDNLPRRLLRTKRREGVRQQERQWRRGKEGEKVRWREEGRKEKRTEIDRQGEGKKDQEKRTVSVWIKNMPTVVRQYSSTWGRMYIVIGCIMDIPGQSNLSAMKRYLLFRGWWLLHYVYTVAVIKSSDYVMRRVRMYLIRRCRITTDHITRKIADLIRNTS